MEIIVLVCLLAQPETCREERLPYVVPTESLLRCSLVSAPFVAEWASERPKWQVVRWRCGAAGERPT